jgi:hypothetical protein
VTAAPLLPSEFLDRIVRPTVEESCRNPQDERLARQAVSELNNLAEKVFHYWGAGSRQVYGAANVSSYRTELAQRECSDFQLVRDIADAHNHVELGRPGRQVTRDDPSCTVRPMISQSPVSSTMRSPTLTCIGNTSNAGSLAI